MIVSQKVLIQSSAGVDVLTDHLKQYEHVFPAESITIHAIRGRLHMDEDGHVDDGDHVAILATCRTIYEEAKPVLYTNIEFVIRLRDQYWLHIWHPDNYVDVFGMGEDSEPDSNDWIAENPWLEDPRLLVPLNNVRKLSLAIEANENAEGRKRTWTEQLKNTPRDARHIAKLHITLDCAPELGFDQKETDETLRIVGQTVRCSKDTTGNMHASLASAGFASASYYHLLAGYGG
jgi:hypothetical protein